MRSLFRPDRLAAALILFAFATPCVAADATTAQQEANRQTVLAFYEKGLNQKDADAALTYVGDRYTQHNPNAQDGPEGFRKFIALLRERYPQYRTMRLTGLPVIALRIERTTSWGNLSRP